MGFQTSCSPANRVMSFMLLFILSLVPIVTQAQMPTAVPNPSAIPTVSPAPTPTPNNGNLLQTGQSLPLTWQKIIAGVVLMVVGLVLCFRGWRHFRFTMFLAGFIAGVIIVYSILVNVEPKQGWNQRAIIYVFSCIGGGIVLGFICWLLHRFTIAILGGLCGLVIALYILSWRNEGLIRNKGGRIGLMAGAAALGLAVGLLFGRRILIPATAIVGAYMTIVGLDMLSRTGFNEAIRKFFTTDENVQYRLTTNLYIMLGLVGGLIVMGFLLQTFSWNRRRRMLLNQNRNPDQDNGWSVFGRSHPTPNQGAAAQPAAYPDNRDRGVTFEPNGVADQDVVYSEKKSWNPFKRNKTTVVRPNPEYANPADNRVSLNSSTPLNP
ncbi:hypothetical protein BGW41_007998 [Actinomortierella wolfii]|nr:hypothetical protein BGW41_007998 [Actinomortierella wolfii]